MSVKYALLSMLAQQPCGAGQLGKMFAASTDNLWPLNVGQVYQTVKRLERDGLVEVAGVAEESSGRSVDIYQVTDLGNTELAAWFSCPLPRADLGRDDLVIKLVMAEHAGEDLQPIIAGELADTLAAIRSLAEKKRQLPPGRTPARIALEKKIFDLEAAAYWLQAIDTGAAIDGDTTSGKGK